MADEPTLGELGRRIDAMGAAMVDRLNHIDSRMDGFVPAALHAADLMARDQRIDDLKADIEELKAAKKWAVGVALMAAGVLIAAIGLILTVVGGGGT